MQIVYRPPRGYLRNISILLSDQRRLAEHQNLVGKASARTTNIISQTLFRLIILIIPFCPHQNHKKCFNFRVPAHFWTQSTHITRQGVLPHARPQHDSLGGSVERTEERATNLPANRPCPNAESVLEQSSIHSFASESSPSYTHTHFLATDILLIPHLTFKRMATKRCDDVGAAAAAGIRM